MSAERPACPETRLRPACLAPIGTENPATRPAADSATPLLLPGQLEHLTGKEVTLEAAAAA